MILFFLLYVEIVLKKRYLLDELKAKDEVQRVCYVPRRCAVLENLLAVTQDVKAVEVDDKICDE